MLQGEPAADLIVSPHRSHSRIKGRRTYQTSAAAWPSRSGDPFSDWVNKVQKYMVSNTLSEKDITWHPTTFIRGDGFLQKVSDLRAQPGATSTCMAAR